MSQLSFLKGLFSSAKPEQTHRIKEHLNQVTFKVSGVTDSELYLLTNWVKSIGTLDLEGTEVSNLGIFYLTNLVSLTSLRLSNCRRINDGCIPFLNQLEGIQYLYINGSDLSLEGLSHLNCLRTLLVLGISAAQAEAHPDVLQQIRTLFSRCKIVIK